MMRMFLMNNVVGELKLCCVEICKAEAIRVTMLLLITKQASPRMEWGMGCGFEQIPSCPELPWFSYIVIWGKYCDTGIGPCKKILHCRICNGASCRQELLAELKMAGFWVNTYYVCSQYVIMTLKMTLISAKATGRGNDMVDDEARGVKFRDKPETSKVLERFPPTRKPKQCLPDFLGYFPLPL